MGLRVGPFVGPSLASTSLTLAFPGSGPWDRCALVADFAAAFLTAGNPSPATANSLSYLVNELVENAVKYGSPGDHVDVVVSLVGTRVTVDVSNSLARRDRSAFVALARVLVDPPSPRPRSLGPPSGIGLLSLVDFYQAQLGFCFRGRRVTVQAQFPVPNGIAEQGEPP